MSGAWLGVLVVLAALSYKMNAEVPDRLRVKAPGYVKLTKKQWRR